MLELVHIDYGFGANTFALKDISLKINRGERVCLFGLNGSGKSTLLRIAAGILTPSAGDVIVDGVIRDSENVGDRMRRLVGFIFQNPDDQILTTSVETELAFVLENLRVERAEIIARISEQAERFDLQNLLKRHPATLSAGEKQRVAVASAIIARPRVLILDEPTSYLDDDGKELLRGIVFSTRDWCVLAATQHISELKDYDTVVYLDDGAIMFAGAVGDFELSHWYREISESQRRIDALAANSPEHSAGVFVKNVEFAYPGERACLAAFEAQFPAGRVTAITGPSGSGKTTLALILAGLLKPVVGEINHGGLPATESERLKRVGMIFQLPESAIFADTVFEEVAFGLLNQGVREPELSARIERALTAVDLEPVRFLERNPFTLSAGEQRLVGIASIIAMDRDVIIFDESTAGLDWNHTRKICELIFGLKRAGKTVIIISHDAAVREQVADATVAL